MDKTTAAERVAAWLDEHKANDSDDIIKAYGTFGGTEFLNAADLRALLAENARLKATVQPEVCAWLSEDGHETTTAYSKAWMENAGFGVWGEVAKKYTQPLGRIVEAQPAPDLFQQMGLPTIKFPNTGSDK